MELSKCYITASMKERVKTLATSLATPILILEELMPVPLLHFGGCICFYTYLPEGPLAKGLADMCQPDETHWALQLPSAPTEGSERIKVESLMHPNSYVTEVTSDEVANSAP